MSPCTPQLQHLRECFARDLKATLVEILKLWNTYVLRLQRDKLASLHDTIAELSASGASLGFADVSAVAMAMEIKLANLLGTPDPPTEDQLHSLKNLIASLAHTIDTQDQQPSAYTAVPVSEIGERPKVPRAEEVYVLGEDNATTAWIAEQIRSFGYAAIPCQDLQDLLARLAGRRPTALVLDSRELQKDSEAVREVLAPDGESAGPLLLVLGEDNLAARLTAAKAGAVAYFPRPVNTAALVDKLDSLLSGALAEPFRILIVDDDLTLSRVYELVLREKGWVTCVVNDPFKILEPLAEFNPDLVLMDLYMPGVSGPEMAAVIRQYEKFVSIPIVFLSMEEDLAKQLSAVSRGADDFLSKAMRPDLLVAALESRVQRYRVLRGHLTRDGLTGLLNHSNLKLRLENEVLRCRRQSARLAFAMIDLDLFKRVNDTHGHLVGDKVLRSLAKLLKQRLRASDIVGRYGGEEFAVVLLDTVDADNAAKLMDTIREAFSEVVHSNDEDFRVTLSCGLATFPEFPDATSLTDAADKALYEAKRSGRNRVVLARPDTTPPPSADTVAKG